MGRKSKNSTSSSKSIVDLGKERKERIAQYRAKKQLEGTRISSVEEAVNNLVDRGLEYESLNIQ